MKVVMTQALCQEGLSLFNGIADVFVANAPNPNEYLETMKECEALIIRIGSCDAHVLENSPKLRVIGRTGVGVDTVDVKKATELGIPVVITPGANNRSVAEHALTMMLALSKNMMELHQGLSGGNWGIRAAGNAFEWEGKTVGILGLGAIGRETAKLCAGCGMKIAGYDPFLSREQIEALGAVWYEDYEALLRECDIVSIHVPLTPSTRHMIARKQLAMMKRTALLVNCSRGGIVCEADLIEALTNGTIAGAAVDVFEQEPPKADDPLLRCPHLIVTPHAAAQTKEAVVRMATLCAEGCLAVCRGEQWPYVADKAVYDHPRWKENAK